MAQSAAAIGQVPFTWEGTDRTGKKVKGKIVAANETAVRQELRRQGVTPERVRKQSMLFRKQGRVGAADIAIFSRQLATMMTAGIPLVQSFDIVGAGHENPAMQKLIFAIKGDVEGGSSLADALAKHPLHFDDLFVSLVAAGEQAGALETLLDKVATYKEKTEAIKKKIKRALCYPAAVVVVAIVVTVILMIYVIPEFESLFKGFGADLPAFTRMVIDVSTFGPGLRACALMWIDVWKCVQSTGWLLLVLTVGVIIGFLQAKKRNRGVQHFVDRAMLRIPIIGMILNKSAIARYARTLSTTFAAGVPLVEALDTVAGACGNIVYETAVRRMRDEVATGQRLQRAMENTELFPNMVNQMIAVGEESGSLDAMSAKVADFYEEEVDNAVDSMSSLLEP